MSMNPRRDGLAHRWLYQIRSRNLAFGVYNAEVNGFVGIREKFNSLYLFTEYVHLAGRSLGTVWAWNIIEPLPEDIELREYFRGGCQDCGNPITYHKEIYDLYRDTPVRKGISPPEQWPWCHDGRPDLDADHNGGGSLIENQALFNWLAAKQSQYYPTWGEWYQQRLEDALSRDPSD